MIQDKYTSEELTSIMDTIERQNFPDNIQPILNNIDAQKKSTKNQQDSKDLDSLMTDIQTSNESIPRAGGSNYIQYKSSPRLRICFRNK